MSQTVLDHYLAVPSSFYTPLDDEHIPTGKQEMSFENFYLRHQFV